MKHRLMDLLACPLDKKWPLKLEIIEEEKETEEIPLPAENPQTKVICNYFCNFKNILLVNTKEDGSEEVKTSEEIAKTVSLSDCKECFQIEIQKGILHCPDENKSHSYNIKEGIPIMLTPEQIKEIYG